jgi:hypothetical protein
MEAGVNARYDAAAITAFHVVRDNNSGQEYGEILFGPDIYPGRSVVDPNSMLSLEAAAAHELAHYHRWRDLRELPSGMMTYLDEALTSLEAVLRYERHLSEHDIRLLISDAVQRVLLYIHESAEVNQSS